MSKIDWEKELPKSEEGKLNVYFHVSENSGVGYYRQYLQAVEFRNSGLANSLISDFRWAEGNHVELSVENLFDVFNWADVVVVGRRDLPQFYAQWGGVREFFNIPIIMDTDDNVQFVRPTNPGYQAYHPGSEAQMWNQYGIGKVFDAITVTTEDLKDFYKKYNPKIYVLPNSLDIKEWQKHERPKIKDGKVRIGFIGSSAHQEGVRLIKPAILKIAQQYPETLFYITHTYAFVFDDYPQEIKDRITWIPWIKLQEWQKGVWDLNLDIGLAPLTDNMFNRAKSNLRWLEYSAAKMASIVSPVKPYLCVKDGVDGLYAKDREDWAVQIERLVKDPDLRYNIQENAYKRICAEFNIAKNIKLWDNVYQEVYNKFHEYFGPKKRFVKIGNKKYQEILKRRFS